MPLTNLPNGLLATPSIGGQLFQEAFASGKVFFVDGDLGSDGYEGTSPDKATKTIARALVLANNLGNNCQGCFIFVKARDMAAGATDPVNYAEALTIPATLAKLNLIGYSGNRTQGGMPQIKKGAGAVALLTVRAPGCFIYGLGFNGGGSTGGGILLDDDGATKSAFGTTIMGCHFKNCRGASATDGSQGGAINWSANGGAWQVLIRGNRFYNNLADIVLLGTGVSVPQDVVIEDNEFGGPAAASDITLYLMAGNGMTGLVIRNNMFGGFPAIGGGANATYMKLTNCVGVLQGNRFGCTGKTFGAAANVVVPATVFMADNWQESAAGANYNIGRT